MLGGIRSAKSAIGFLFSVAIGAGAGAAIRAAIGAVAMSIFSGSSGPTSGAATAGHSEIIVAAVPISGFAIGLSAGVANSGCASDFR